jgi:hypothetical protein
MAVTRRIGRSTIEIGRPVPLIGVWPRDDDIRRFLTHPMGQGFQNYPEATPWPHDQFTMRRIIDGDVLTERPTELNETTV